MNYKELSLMQKLINCTISSSLDHTAGIIAQYLLLNYANLGHLSPNRVSEECFVSLSSVRRFCVKLGYENFSDMVRAKKNNPEDQQAIARYNLESGCYKPGDLRIHINDAMYSAYRSVDAETLQQLAAGILRAKALILFCTRPYNMWLREFQNQLTAWGRSVYIIEDSASCRDLVQMAGEPVYSFVVSPMACHLEPFFNECKGIPGEKSVLVCRPYLSEPEYQQFLAIYDTVLSLCMKSYSYEYLEIVGKYAVAYLFDVLLGELLTQLRKTP